MNEELITIASAVCAGISIFCFTITIYNLMTMIEVEKGDQEYTKPLPIIMKLSLPLASNMRFIANSEAMKSTKEKVEKMLVTAGYDQIIKAESFVGLRFVNLIIGLILLGLFVAANKPLYGIVIPALLYLYPSVWLKSITQKRHKEILKALPNILDLLTLSVQAGKDFITSLKDILDRRKIDAIGEELGRTFQEIQLGKKRQQALKDLGLRVRLPELTSIVNAIVQAEEMGVSIGELLAIQGDQLRNKRFSEAEKLANEAPVKIIPVIAIFIFPAVLIVLMVPMLLPMLKSLVS